MSPYVEEVKLINLAADAVGEEEHISLEPRHGLSRILEADAGTAHDDWRMMRTRSWKTESVKWRARARARAVTVVILLQKSKVKDKLDRGQRAALRDYLEPLPGAEVRWQLPLAPRVWGLTRHPPGSDNLAMGSDFDLIKKNLH